MPFRMESNIIYYSIKIIIYYSIKIIIYYNIKNIIYIMTHKAFILLLLLNTFNNIESFYAYDRFNNRQVPLIYNDNYVFYTSDMFHTIEYSDKINKNITNNNINKNKFIVNLRNSSKSLPDIRL